MIEGPGMATLRRFLGRDAGHVAQFIKYGMAGGMATLTHIVIFFGLGWRLLPCLTEDDIVVRLLRLAPVVAGNRALNAALATVLAFMVANAVAYTLNILFVFKSGRHHWALEILFFYIVSGVSMIIGTSLQSLLIARYGIMTTLAFGTNILAALMINYAMRKFFIFKA